MAHKHAELIKKWADGAEIEVYTDSIGQWVPTLNPRWNPAREYRVRPETRKFRVAEFIGGVTQIIPESEYMLVRNAPAFKKWSTVEFEVEK